MSLKGDKYETMEEVNFRLANTVVLYENKPVFITRVGPPEMAGEDAKEVCRVYFRDLPLKIENSGKEHRKYLSSRNFDLTPFKMGYMNYDNEAVFVARNPIRQNRQGLSRETTTFTDIRGRPKGGLGFNDILSADGFSDMVNGIFPSFKEVGEKLGNKDTSSVAVSRSFAFYIEHDLDALLLMHKGIKCGIALKGEKGLKIPPKFHFLKQEMEEHRIPIA